MHVESVLHVYANRLSNRQELFGTCLHPADLVAIVTASNGEERVVLNHLLQGKQLHLLPSAPSVFLAQVNTSSVDDAERTGLPQRLPGPP